MPRKPTWNDVPRYTDGKFAKRQRINGQGEGISTFRQTSITAIIVVLNVFIGAALPKALGIGGWQMIVIFLGAIVMAIPLGRILSQRWLWFGIYALVAIAMFLAL
jgi:hypothetical protein